MEGKNKVEKSGFKVTYQWILFILLVGILALFAIFGNGVIIKPKVLFGLTEHIMEMGLMALPMTLIIITGGIDLSVGTTMALCAVVTGSVYAATSNIIIAIICCFITGILCGSLNGLIISRTKISPLITTLATFSLFYGIAKIISGTHIFSKFPEGFSFLQKYKLFNIVPYQFVLFVVLFIIYNIIYSKTVLGRYIRGIGLNEVAVEYSGINIRKIKYGLYLISGITSALASLVYLSRLPAAKPDIGANLNLETISAVVLGGTSIMGGVGSVTGTFLGVLVLGVLRKGLQIIGIGGDIYSFVIGIILVFCLISFSYIDNREKKIKKK